MKLHIVQNLRTLSGQAVTKSLPLDAGRTPGLFQPLDAVSGHAVTELLRVCVTLVLQKQPDSKAELLDLEKVFLSMVT
jgi:hypothetical protein